ncbi:hypothetical protein [Enterovirga sp. CN4-39]|uniref:hypothetical protein n=1 Tax=Enterovirga sp. CN4-39 TaxID=3400910 RepID=UPI003C0B45E5
MFKRPLLGVVTLFNVSLVVVHVVAVKTGWLAPEPSQGFWLLLQQKPGPASVEYKDFVSIILTAASLMIALLAFALAALAIWGYREIRSQLLRAAIKSARRSARVEARVQAPPIARRAAIEWLQTSKIAPDTLSNDQMERMMGFLDADGEGNGR